MRELAIYSEPGHVYTPIWRCPDTTLRCYYNFAYPTPFAGLLDGLEVEIPEGVYHGLAIETCNAGETSVGLQVDGSVTLGGTNYVVFGSAPLRADVPDSALAVIPFEGCAMEFPFAQPQLVQRDRELSLQAGFTIRDAGFASTGDIGDWDGCVRGPGGSVCVATPSLVIAPASETLRLESYLISEDVTDETGATSGGELLMVIDSSNRPFAGFSRRFYSETSVFPTVLYDTPFAECLPADDGTVSIRTYDTGGSSYRSWFPAFQRANHTGTLTLPDGIATIPYRAYRQTP